MRDRTGLRLGQGFGRCVAHGGPVMAGGFHGAGLGGTAARVVGGMPLAFACVDRVPGRGLAVDRTPRRMAGVDHMSGSVAARADGLVPVAFPAVESSRPGGMLAVDRMPGSMARADGLVPMAFPAVDRVPAGVLAMAHMPGRRTGVPAVNGLMPVAVSAMGAMPGRVTAMEGLMPGFARSVDGVPVSMAVAVPIAMPMPAAVMAMGTVGVAVAMPRVMGMPSIAPAAAVMVGRRVQFGRVAMAFVGIAAGTAAFLVALPEPGAQVVDALLRAAADVVIVFVLIIRCGEDQGRGIRDGGVGGLAPRQPSTQD